MKDEADGVRKHPGACGNQCMVLSGNYGKTSSSLRRKKGKFILMSGDSWLFLRQVQGTKI